MRRVKSRFADDEEEAEDAEVAFSAASQLAWVHLLDETAKLNDRPTSDGCRKRSWKDMHGPGKGAKVKGPFTAAEDEMLKKQLGALFDLQGWSWDEGMQRMLKERMKSRDVNVKSHWLFISEALPDRRIESVIQRVQGYIYPWPRKGRWTEEENKKLAELGHIYPRKWREMSTHLGRYWRTIRDHYNELVDKGMLARYEEQSGGSRESPHRKTRRLWTKAEEAALLESVRQITGLKFPLSHIPWLFVATTTKASIPNRTASDLRLHYNLALLPRAATVHSWKDVCKRQGLRHLKKLIRLRSDIHWTEIDFAGVLPFWPITTMKSRMKSILLNYGGFSPSQANTEEATRFFNDGAWRQVVLDAARALDLKRWRAEDIKAIEAYLARLREYNGGDRHALGTLPQDTEAEALRNYSRRKLKELRAFETSRRTAQVEAGWRAREKEGASTNEYVDYHIEAALDLLDEDGPVIEQPTSEAVQSDSTNADKGEEAQEEADEGSAPVTGQSSGMATLPEPEKSVDVEDGTPSTQAGNSPFIVIPSFDDEDDDRFFV